MDTVKPEPFPERTAEAQTLYSVNQAALVLGLKPDTLRWHLRRQHHVKPQRLSPAKNGTLVLTASDVALLWEIIKTERGY